MRAIVLLCTILFYKSVLASNLPVYGCKREGTTCTFSNVRLNPSGVGWQPSCDDPKVVRTVKFTGSGSIFTLTRNICDYFPNVREIEMNDQGIQQIRQDAFINCHQLTFLNLQRNQIQELHQDTFFNLTNLQYLGLRNNQISKLHLELFATLRSLKSLELGANNLTEFHPDHILHNNLLDQLYIASNDLSDIDIETILAMRPKIFYMALDDNEFSCTRSVEIYNFLFSKNVKAHHDRYRIRYYPQETIFGTYICNPDISWMASNYRKTSRQIEHQLREPLMDDERYDNIEKRFNQLENQLEEMMKLILSLSQ